MKPTLLLFCSLLFISGLKSQVITRNMLVRYHAPSFRLSVDEKFLVMDESTEKDEMFAVLVNLTDWSHKGSVMLYDTWLTPDLTHSYAQYFGEYKGTEKWKPRKKHSAIVYTNLATGGSLLQWPDHNYIVATMPDGNFLASDDVVFKKNNNASPKKIKGLKVIDPASGNTIRELRKDKVVDIEDNMLYGNARVIDNGKLLVRQTYSMGYATIGTESGKEISFATLMPLTHFAGGLGIAVEHNTSSFRDSYKTNRKVVYDMWTGKLLLDTFYKNMEQPIYAATGSDNHIYTYDVAAHRLNEEEWNDGKLVLVSSKLLDSSGVKAWDAYHGQKYTLLIAKKSGKVMLIPNQWKQVGDKLNEMYGWNLNTGKLEYKVSNFYMPHDHFLAKMNLKKAQDDAYYAQPVKKFTANTLVKAADGYHYVLQNFDESRKMWQVLKLSRDRHGMYEATPTEKASDYFSHLSSTTVSATFCNVCGGGRSVSGTSERSSTSVDNYNARAPGAKIITTKTSTVQTMVACKACKGTGFVF